MKSSILKTEASKKPIEFNFPCLLRSKLNGDVIVARNRQDGTILHVNENKREKENFYYTIGAAITAFAFTKSEKTNFCPSEWELVSKEEQVILRND